MITGRSPPRSISPAMRPAGAPKAPREHRVIGQNAPRVDLAAKVFGAAGLYPRHDVGRHGARARRAPAAPRRHDRHARRGGDPPRRQRRRSISSAAAISSRSSAPTKPLSMPPPRWRRAMWSGTASTRSTRFRKRRAGCCSSPRSTGRSARRRHPPRPGGAPRGDLYPHAHRPCLGRRRPAGWRLSRWAARRVDAFARRLSAARCARPHPEARSRNDPGHARPGAGLLWP